MEIPFFIKKLGHKIIAYILNISNDDAKQVLENKFELNNNHKEVLKQYIGILKAVKIKNIDQDNINLLLFSELANAVTENKEHYFNYYRKFCGGEIPSIYTDCIIEKLVYKLAIETYPLFLLKIENDFSHNIGLSQMTTSVFYNLSENKQLQDELLKDTILEQLFSKGKNEYDTLIKSHSSAGASSIQLALVPQLIVTKIYELMVLKREVTLDYLEKYTKSVIAMYRELATNKKLKVSSFIGFENISIPNDTYIQDTYGCIRGYDKVLYEKLPQYLRPLLYNGDDNYLGFVLETNFDYEIELDISLDENYKFPSKYHGKYDNINKIKDNLSLAFTLSNDEKVIGIKSRWILIFNILSHGTSVSYSDRIRSNNITTYSQKELETISEWYNKIHNTNDSKIEIAINRVLSATSNRNNNLDSFIDSIIALENIFGHGSGEIGFKLSMGVAFLLKNKPEEIELLQKIVNDLYSNRSKVLHGAKKLSVEQEQEYMEKSLRIAIDCIKALYLQPKLLEDKNRGKTIIFNATHNKSLEEE